MSLAGWLPRAAGSLLGGAVLTLLLFWSIQLLLKADGVSRPDDVQRPVLSFLRLTPKEAAPPPEKRRAPKPPPETPEPPPQPPDQPIAVVAPRVSMPRFDFSPPRVPLNLGGPYLGPVREGLPDRDFLVVARVPPRYPYRAERRGIEGWVKVSFLITENGAVRDLVVLEAEPEGVFDQAALDAVRRWQFKPRISAGQPVAVRAEQVVRFRLKEGS